MFSLKQTSKRVYCISPLRIWQGCSRWVWSHCVTVYFWSSCPLFLHQRRNGKTETHPWIHFSPALKEKKVWIEFNTQKSKNKITLLNRWKANTAHIRRLQNDVTVWNEPITSVRNNCQNISCLSDWRLDKHEVKEGRWSTASRKPGMRDWVFPSLEEVGDSDCVCVWTLEGQLVLLIQSKQNIVEDCFGSKIPLWHILLRWEACVRAYVQSSFPLLRVLRASRCCFNICLQHNHFYFILVQHTLDLWQAQWMWD